MYQAETSAFQNMRNVIQDRLRGDYARVPVQRLIVANTFRTALFLLRPKFSPVVLPRFRTGTPMNSRLVMVVMSSWERLASFCHCCSLVASSFSGWVAT